MIEKAQLLEKIYEELPYMKDNSSITTRIDLLYELFDADNSFHELINTLHTSNSRNMESYLAEVNIIYDIIQNSPYLKASMKYEQDSGKGKPDLQIEIDDIVIWIQLKCFSTSKLDKEFNASIQLLKDNLSDKFNCFFDIKTSYALNLSEDEIEVILKGVYEKGECLYNQNGNIVDIKKNSRKYNVILPSGFISTNTYNKQIESSFNTAEKSLPEKDKNTINIIICQNINHRQNNIDIGNVLFGKEYECYYGEGNHYWGRKNNGKIHNKNNKINYYCIYQAHDSVISNYCNKWLFVLEETSVLDIPEMLGIDAKYHIRKYDYIEGT